jgi:hypothetical protein
MVEQIKHITDLSPLHWALAYTGLIVHILMKIGNMKGSLLNNFSRKFIMSSIASFLLIPAILLICTDTGMKELLPINYLTAFLAGYQTQSLMANVLSLKRIRTDEPNNDEDRGYTPL